MRHHCVLHRILAHDRMPVCFFDAVGMLRFVCLELGRIGFPFFARFTKGGGNGYRPVVLVRESDSARLFIKSSKYDDHTDSSYSWRQI